MAALPCPGSPPGAGLPFICWVYGLEGLKLHGVELPLSSHGAQDLHELLGQVLADERLAILNAKEPGQALAGEPHLQKLKERGGACSEIFLPAREEGGGGGGILKSKYLYSIFWQCKFV